MPDKQPSSFSDAMSKTQDTAPGMPPEVPATPSTPKVVTRPLTGSKASTRRGTRQVGGHFDPAVSRQINIIAAEEDTTVQELVAEALDMLFQSRGRSIIARRQPDKATA